MSSMPSTLLKWLKWRHGAPTELSCFDRNFQLRCTSVVRNSKDFTGFPICQIAQEAKFVFPPSVISWDNSLGSTKFMDQCLCSRLPGKNQFSLLKSVPSSTTCLSSQDLSCLSKENKGCPSSWTWKQSTMLMHRSIHGKTPHTVHHFGPWLSNGLLFERNPRLLDAYDCLASADGRPDETIFGRKVQFAFRWPASPTKMGWEMTEILGG